MMTTPNPYQSPPIVDQREADRAEAEPVKLPRRHHLSNRLMSLVFGLPGLAMFIVASGILIRAGMIMMDARSGTAYPVLFLFGIMGLLLGVVMLSVAVVLWRYDSRRTTPQSKTQIPSRSPSL